MSLHDHQKGASREVQLAKKRSSKDSQKRNRHSSDPDEYSDEILAITQQHHGMSVPKASSKKQIQLAEQQQALANRI